MIAIRFLCRLLLIALSLLFSETKKLSIVFCEWNRLVNLVNLVSKRVCLQWDPRSDRRSVSGKISIFISTCLRQTRRPVSANNFWPFVIKTKFELIMIYCRKSCFCQLWFASVKGDTNHWNTIFVTDIKNKNSFKSPSPLPKHFTRTKVTDRVWRK